MFEPNFLRDTVVEKSSISRSNYFLFRQNSAHEAEREEKKNSGLTARTLSCEKREEKRRREEERK